MESIYVLDSSAIFLRKVHGNAVTVPEVVEEIVDEDSRFYLSIKMESHELKVENSREEFVSEVREAAKKTGDIHRLSSTDLSVLAKALELKRGGKRAVIVTDDYSIQNMASVLDIDVEAVIQKGISRVFKWVKVCRGCGRRIESDVCPVCGGEAMLKKVIKSKEDRRGKATKR